MQLRNYNKSICLQANSAHSVHCYCNKCTTRNSASTLQRATKLQRYYIYSTTQRAYVNTAVTSVYAFASVNYVQQNYKSVKRDYVTFCANMQNAVAYTQAQCTAIIQNALRYTHSASTLQLITVQQ